jgi:glycosyltransferase involved in cell wall biosynthesis
MQALAAELGVDRHIVWTGEYRWDNDLASVYLRAADACVLPFDTGVKLNNSSFSSAAAHGLPILTTMAAVVEPQFVHRENVFLCAPQSGEALAEGVRVLMDDPSLCTTLARGSLRLAHDWYSWETALDKTLSLFRAPAGAFPAGLPQSAH